jgi:hypothetical protein
LEQKRERESRQREEENKERRRRQQEQIRAQRDLSTNNGTMPPKGGASAHDVMKQIGKNRIEHLNESRGASGIRG